MHYAVGLWAGAGTDPDPFRPPTDQDYSLIDLRPDAGALDGICIIATPEREDAIGEYLGDAVDVVSRAQIQAVRRVLGINLDDGLTLAQALGVILTTEARTDGTRWKPLVPRPTWAGPKEPISRFEVCLGGQRIWSQDVPRIGGAGRIFETFDKANSSTLGPVETWVEDIGNWEVFNNRARVNGTWLNIARPDVLMDGNDHEAVVEPVISSATTGFGGAMLRYTPGSSSTRTYYRFEYGVSGTTNAYWRVAKMVGGSTSYIANHTTGAPPNPDERLFAKVVGSTLSGRMDELGADYGPYTDTSITTGRSVAIHVFGTSSTTDTLTVQLDFPDFKDVQSNIDTSGTVAVSGLVRKSPAKGWAGSTQPSGSLGILKVVYRLFTGAIAVSGHMQRSFTGLLSGTIELSGALTKTVIKGFAGSTQPAAAMMFHPVKFFAGTLQPAGEVVLKAVGRIFGRPGIVDSAIRAAGEVRARFRMRG